MGFAGPIQSCHSKLSRQTIGGTRADESTASCHQYQLRLRCSLHRTFTQQDRCPYRIDTPFGDGDTRIMTSCRYH